VRRPLVLAALALAALVAGCSAPPPPPPAAPTRTPTPAPVADVVAFTRAGSLWLTRSDGQGVRLLAAPGRNQDFWFPASLPDGSGFLAWLSRSDGTQDVVRVDLATGKSAVLTDTGEKAEPLMKSLSLGNSPSGSPDGKKIAYCFNGNLWVMDASGYNAETLISDGASWAPAYSPDGRHIAYVNGRNGHFDLWVTDVDSHDTYQVTDFSEYTVGHPRWSPKGEKLLLTRTQGEENDVVEVDSHPDSPAADADVLTKDHLSAAAVFSPAGTGILFSSARADSVTWDLYAADATGASVRQVTHDGALSPDWMQPSTASASTLVFSFARPTPLPSAVPTAAPAAQAAPSHASAAPSQAAAGGASALLGFGVGPAPSGAIHVALLKPAPAKPAIQAAAAAVPSASAPAPAAASAPVPAPTAPPAQAAAPAPQPLPQAATAAPAPAKPAAAGARTGSLRMRYKASFDDKENLDPGSLAELRKLASKVAQYAGEPIVVVGPLDTSGLKGRYASNEERSTARAQAVGSELARLAGVDASSIKPEPYSPPSAGGAANEIHVYVELARVAAAP